MGCKIRIILFYDPLFNSPPNFLFFEQKSQGEKIEETKKGRGITYFNKKVRVGRCLNQCRNRTLAHNPDKVCLCSRHCLRRWRE